MTAPAQAGPAAAQRAPIQPAAAEGPAKAAAARGAAAGGARWRRAGAASQLVQALGGAVGARGRGARRGAACAPAVLCARRKRAGASAGPASQTLRAAVTGHAYAQNAALPIRYVALLHLPEARRNCQQAAAAPARGSKGAPAAASPAPASCPRLRRRRMIAATLPTSGAPAAASGAPAPAGAPGAGLPARCAPAAPAARVASGGAAAPSAPRAPASAVARAGPAHAPAAPALLALLPPPAAPEPSASACRPGGGAAPAGAASPWPPRSLSASLLLCASCSVLDELTGGTCHSTTPALACGAQQSPGQQAVPSPVQLLAPSPVLLALFSTSLFSTAARSCAELTPRGAAQSHCLSGDLCTARHGHAHACPAQARLWQHCSRAWLGPARRALTISGL